MHIPVKNYYSILVSCMKEDAYFPSHIDRNPDRHFLDENLLLRFSKRELAAAQTLELTNHLDHCGECQKRLREVLSIDTVITNMEEAFGEGMQNILPQSQA